MLKSLTISIDELINLKNKILEKKLVREPVKSDYELLRVNDGKIKLIVYKSGKVVYEDTIAAEKLIKEILEFDRGFHYLLGSDETGKGEWYGPLVVTAVSLSPEQVIKLRQRNVRDSKQLSKEKLFEIGTLLHKMNIVEKTVVLRPKKYNSMYDKFIKEGKNLNDLLAWAHSAAIKDVLKATKRELNIKLVIDKFDVKKMDLRLNTLDKSNIEIIQKSKGESFIPVATASIIAKLTFEEEVNKLNEKYNIDLRRSTPEKINKEILPFVAKTHFKNVIKYLE